MEEIDAPARAEEVGALLSKELGGLPAVVGVRGLGALLAVELVPELDAREVAAQALEQGLVVNAVTPSALRLAPNFFLTAEEVDEAAWILAQVSDVLLADADATVEAES
jgi:acetylornithine aminotransferase